MKILIINKSEVQQLMTLEECMSVMANALKTLARGNAGMPLRSAMWLPEKNGLLATMPAFIGAPKVMGVKILSVFPGNHGTKFDSHQGAVMLFDAEHGQPLAIIAASAITAIRTAAVSGVATKLLAREDACDLAILGSGTQAIQHLSAMLLIRDIRRVRVWSLPIDHAHQFAERESKRHGIKIETMNTAHEAVKGADIICTVTAATEPILFGKSISEGTHINAVGACSSTTRELDTEAVVKSILFVDRRESTLNEAGDFLIPKNEGVINDSHIRGEIGELLIGNIKGRNSASEITLFKALGLAVEDIAAAQYIYLEALDKALGLAVELEGFRPEHA